MTDKPRLRTSADGTTTVSYDGLQNVVSGLGTGADKRSHNRFAFSGSYFNFAELEAAYSDNWIARQVVDVPVADALREWREWKHKDANQIRKEEKRLKLRSRFASAQRWGRLYGGGAILMVTDQPLDDPLDIKKIGKGSLKRLVTLDRWELAPQVVNYTNPIAEDYLMPEWYTVVGGTGLIHSSHLIRIDGEDLPRRLRALNQSWGDSRLRQVLEDLKDVTSTKSGIAAMVQEANVDVISREGLSNELATDQEDAILKRFALGAQMKSLVNMLLLDGEETYERKQLSFSGLEGVFDKLMIWISGAAEIPMTRLFGRSAAGMNATGEGDMGNYYDALAGVQEDKYRTELEQLDAVMVRSALGDYPEDCEWEWNPLYQESGTELAQQELAYAQSEEIRERLNILKPSHAMLRLKNTGRYAITDEEIEAQKKIEEMDVDPFGGEGDDEGGFTPAMDAALENGYVSVRPSPESAQKIKAHLDSIGIDGAITPEEMHVTLMYSREGIPGAEAVPSADGKSFKATAKTEPHVIGNDPWRALVIDLESSDLKARHNEIKQGGAKHSYPDFRPHLSVKYSPTDDDLQKLKDAPLDMGEIEFSDEQWKPVK